MSSSHDEDAHDVVDDDGDDDEAVGEDDEDEQVDVGGDLTSYLSRVFFFCLFHFEGLQQHLMSRTSSIEQYSNDECRRENHHIGYVLCSCLHCVHQR